MKYYNHPDCLDFNFTQSTIFSGREKNCKVYAATYPWHLHPSFGEYYRPMSRRTSVKTQKLFADKSQSLEGFMCEWMADIDIYLSI